MQSPQTPNTRPIARHLKNQRSNMADPTSRAQIYRECYRDYLLTKLNISNGAVEQLIKLYTQLIDRENIDSVWALPMPLFHKAFLQKLNNL
mgnify:CR=1 FL=1